MLSLQQKSPTKCRCRELALVALIPLTALITGCGNSCFAFVSNPGGGLGTAAFSSPCPAPIQNASVQVAVRLSRQCESCSPSNQIQSLIIAVRGIELHPQTNPAEGPAIWQELFPNLEIEPQQFKLSKAIAGGLAASSLRDTARIPAGSYDLVQLRLAANQASAGIPIAAENKCGSVGLHCAVMGDGRVLPLALDGGTLELRLSSQNSSSGVLLVLPDSENQLLIELTAVWSLDSPAGGNVRLIPVLRGSARISNLD